MTPAEIAALSACFSCLPDRQAALLFLLARIANVTIDQINAGAACYRCVGDIQAATLFLLNTIVTNGSTGGGGGGTGGVVCQAGVPVAAPTNACTLSYDTATGILYYWTGAAWAAVTVGGSSGVTCGAVAPVAAPAGACGLYYDTVSTALYYWDGAAWQLKV